ncbi:MULTISPECIES: YHS domain-containing protein [Chryseobacterium]|uniref:YHS domain-containing protein n=1 Tax=Chryseobacterium TaxID=59732 RepID=UPI001BE522A9|nr:MULTISPECIES: YHS domain-containing protein [Chryseobacterium]MBT2621838.1 YHS domain-containing protein [Chryseobacterium sp. ISL-6]
MKHKLILTALLSISLLSCAQEAPKVKHSKSMDTPKENLKNVKVVNAEDPVCHMKTADYLKFTATYKNKVYGFCSASCKNEFNKNPEKYVQK